MGKKRGQFTIFIILGLVLVISFALILFIRDLALQGQAKIEAATAVQDFLQQSTLQSYVESCLEQATTDAIVKLGLQGGALYLHQDGDVDITTQPDGNVTIPFNVTEYNETYDVSYGITLQNETCINPSAPNYPFQYKNFQEILLFFLGGDCFGGPYGRRSLSLLCNADGPNSLEVRTDRTGNVKIFDCSQNEYSKAGNVQNSLENYIAKKVQSCADFSIFEQRFQHNISVGVAQTTVIYGNSGITVKLHYPVTVLVWGKRPIIDFMDFQIKKDIRLKRSFDIARELIRKESQEIFFDPANQTQRTNDASLYGLLDSSFFIEVIPNSCVGCTTLGAYDDVMRIYDNYSLIKGKPFILEFAIKNRRPVLDYIKYEPIDRFDYVVPAGEEIFFKPIGKDADDDPVNYTYKGWRENYYTDFDFDCCKADTVPPGNGAKCINQCQIRKNVVKNNWTKSSEYLTTQHSANYMTNLSDSGWHFTSVWIQEPSGLVDYQNVSILVFNLPNPVLEVSNIYSDINDSHASIEDPYTMTTIGSHIDWFNATIVNRTYFRLAGNDQFNVTKAITSLDLPLTTRNISNITETIFTKSNFVPSPPDQYKKYQLNFTLFAKYSLPPMEFWTVPVTKDVEVYACLPYRTTAAAPDIFPYTDTLSGDDPFLANHSCCHDGTTGSPYGTIFGIGENQVCFNESEFGPFFAFDLNKYKKPQPFGLTAISIPYSSTQTFSMPADINRPEANDIFTRTFNRYCDGKRGNICNGSMTDDFEITPANQCFDGETWQEERCVGPHQDYFNSVPGGDLSTPTTCALYTGDTFEKRAVNAGLTADPAITGYCGRGACTSAPGATYGDVEFDIDPSRSDKGVACKAGCNAGVCTLDVSTCVCDNTFCSASSAACNNLPPNTIYPSPPEDPKSGQYCDGECGLVSCPNNYAVINTGPSLSCYTACDHANNGAGGQNDACKTGFTCDADVTSASLNTCI